MAKSKTAESRAADGGERKRVQSEFPKDTLEQALRVANALAEANGGRPLPPIETATALGVSPGSSDFRVLLSSSLKYGLTQGSYKSDRVSLDALGREIVEPTSSESQVESRLLAALTPPTFRAIYDYFKGKKLPEKTFFDNTVVREFSVPREHADACVRVFTSNMEFVGLIRATKTGRWLSTDSHAAGRIEAIGDDASSDLPGEGELPGVTSQPPVVAPSVPPISPPSKDSRERRVFITHGKDKSFVEPIKKLLGFGELTPVVSVEQQSVSKPVSDKVMDDMRSCGAAIIHVHAEKTLIDGEANQHTVINPNVLIEIGAAMALYGRRFILLVRDGVTLPSNLQGLYEVRYVGDALDGDATIRLLEAINDIKKNALPVAGGA